MMICLEETYNQAIRISRNMVEDIRFGRQLYFQPVEKYTAQICKYLDGNDNILSFLYSVQDKNPYLHSHPVNVAYLSFVIGKWLGMDLIRLEKLVLAGLLHDIGKAKMKDSLLNKAETLTIEEMETLKAHPVISYKILKNYDAFDAEVLQAVLLHHERMDGSGYPLGIKGNQINLFSRIIAIADTFDAITSDRAYSKKLSPLQALEEIRANSHKHLDPEISHMFIQKYIDFYSGLELRENDEQGLPQESELGAVDNL